MNTTHISTRWLTLAFAAGAFALLAFSAQAQVASDPYGAPRSAASTSGAAQTNTQSAADAGRPQSNSTAHRRANSGTVYGRAGSAAGTGSNSAYSNSAYNVSNAAYNNASYPNANVYLGASTPSYFGYPDLNGYGTYVGQPITAVANNIFDGLSNGTGGGALAVGNLILLSSPVYGGFATFGPNGGYSFGQTGGYAVFSSSFNGFYNPNYRGVNSVSPVISNNVANGKDTQIAPTPPVAPSLAQ